ncbi:hypothetical protein COX05_01260 [candidate division WWE3 bacterium CG22_combo_CG10-13_8_21_14_all_39_12]|uniref:NgoFVII family restriction endonuclease n=1 Tax=candidate division WWE3 bacterium CG22_combo_CG10-13_8_21_14_all_39_12 TaxID=1975094 RepID=A0A2H0BIE9_UNCKA|nr:MAG: hypothetical protein COX05_01260 [candidate division WWE3 bacterium CG22_combo_CG10-13_8_21_14_all_39_12]
MYTNTIQYGGNFLDIVDAEFESATSVAIASGYTSFDILHRYKDKLINISRNGGSSKLLLGMAFYEGLSHSKLDLLTDLSQQLESINNSSGVFVTYSGKFHGKVYQFCNNTTSKTFIGSSNFSRSGLKTNMECTTLLTDPITIASANSFLDFIFSQEDAVSIINAEITVPGTRMYQEKIRLDTLDDLQRYIPQTINTTLLESFEYSLQRIATKEKSNLNVYFGKGRLNRNSGVVSPRAWYEVELIAPRELSSLDLYPKGDFLAYTDDGYILPMKTSGDYYKNIRSKDNLRILGQWIKGKLQKSGALIPLTPVTEDTLETYGTESIKFYHIDTNRYYLKF